MKLRFWPFLALFLGLGLNVNGTVSQYAHAGDNCHKNLKKAIDHGQLDKVEAQIEQGCSLDTTILLHRYSTTVLSYAVKKNKPVILKYLIAQGADLNKIDITQGRTALMWAAAKNNTNAIQILVSAGARINQQGKYQQTALMLAAKMAHHQAVKTLLTAGADKHIRDNQKRTALDHALAYRPFNEKSKVKKLETIHALEPEVNF